MTVATTGRGFWRRTCTGCSLGTLDCVEAPAADPRSFSDFTHLGFDGASVRHRMGLRPLTGAWLEPDQHRDWQLDLKRSLLADDRSAYLLEPSSAAAADGVAALVEHLSAEGVDAAPTIEGCGTATQEDWCVMVREDTWRLSAACVCFPSQWALTAKAGGTVAEIHAPVPGYEQDLGGLVESFFDRLGDDRTVWRTNWNLWDDPRLAQPWSEADAPEFDPPAVDEVPERVFLRVERQTVRRLTPDAVAFSIRVHQRPLGHLETQPGALDLLRSTLSGPVGEVLVSKKVGRLGPSVVAWLGLSTG